DLIQSTNHIFALQPLSDFDGQAFPCEHVQNRQSSKPPPIGQLVGYEIQTPHLVGSPVGRNRSWRCSEARRFRRGLCRIVRPSSRYNRYTSFFPTFQPSRFSNTRILR